MAFTGAVPCSVLLLLLLLCASPTCQGEASQQQHNITAILAAASPDFAQFSAALAAANLTGNIDSKTSITVLAIDNAAVARLVGRRLTPDSLGRVLSLHVLLDYIDDSKLHDFNSGGTMRATSLYQESGTAPGAAGIVTITRDADGHVLFRPVEAAGRTTRVLYLKPVKESPFDIAVLRVSEAISSTAAETKAPAPPVPAPAPAPKAPAPASRAPVATPAPATAPALPPSPKNHTAPPPKPVPAPAPVAEPPADEPAADDDQPPADGAHKSGASDSEPWSLGAVVAVAAPVLVFLLW